VIREGERGGAGDCLRQNVKRLLGANRGADQGPWRKRRLSAWLKRHGTSISDVAPSDPIVGDSEVPSNAFFNRLTATF
jgi:hypothetical protein